MISFNGIDITFSNMGLFSTKEPWIHPKRIIDSYEIIYCMEGNFYIIEEGVYYNVSPQTVLFLHPNKQHLGFRKTTTPTKFYWLHFYCTNFEKLNLKKIYTDAHFINNINHLFRELASLQNQLDNQVLEDIKLLELLMKFSHYEPMVNNKIFSELKEYIRIHSNQPITTTQIAENFNYTSGHLSRMFKRKIGIPLRDYIIDMRLDYVKSMLLNSNYIIKEVSEFCGFENENSFVKFFKHHTGITPTEYRNNHSTLHMNVK